MHSPFNLNEKRLLAVMSTVTLINRVGVSMVLPIFSIYATALPFSSGALAGLATGILGFSQVLFQVPMGKLSDRWGRKEATMLGLTLYAVGSVYAGMSTTIFHLIAARFIAGAGAISGITMAWLTDDIRMGRRNEALAFIGISHGVSSLVGMTISPVIAGMLGVPLLFHCNALFAILSILCILLFLKSNSIKAPYAGDSSSMGLSAREITSSHANRITQGDSLRLMVAGFIASFIFAGTFYAIPVLITRVMGLQELWKLLAPAALLGTLGMFIFARRADRRGARTIAVAGFAAQIAGVIIPLCSGEPLPLAGSFILVYCGHCILSPVLPAAVSHSPDSGRHGTFMGIFTASQLLGIALGGTVGGILTERAHGLLFALLLNLAVAGSVCMAGYGGFRNREAA